MIMFALLQINANRSLAAMDLAMATAGRYGAKFILVSEPHLITLKNRNRWFVDRRKDAAIGFLGSSSQVTATGAGEGFVWVRTDGIVVYSCYISPNITMDIFELFVRNLAEDIRAKGRCKIVLTGDFNAKAPECPESGMKEEIYCSLCLLVSI